jgi:hypothetical protein
MSSEEYAFTILTFLFIIICSCTLIRAFNSSCCRVNEYIEV